VSTFYFQLILSPILFFYQGNFYPPVFLPIFRRAVFKQGAVLRKPLDRHALGRDTVFDQEFGNGYGTN
jgi:hypothetical protein